MPTIYWTRWRELILNCLIVNCGESERLIGKWNAESGKFKGGSSVKGA